MILYLIFCSLLIPLNIWAAITPHLHGELSMRILHGVATVVLMPLLWALWTQRGRLQPLGTLVLTTYAAMLVSVNIIITVRGMGIEFGWLDHLFLALSEVAVVVFFLAAPDGSDQPTSDERTT